MTLVLFMLILCEYEDNTIRAIKTKTQVMGTIPAKRLRGTLWNKMHVTKPTCYRQLVTESLDSCSWFSNEAEKSRDPFSFPHHGMAYAPRKQQGPSASCVTA